MKILYVTTIGPTMGFFTNFIKKLLEEGNTVDIATNTALGEAPDCYREWRCKVFDIDCTRTPFSKGNVLAIGQIRRIVEQGGYDIVHCHTPIAAACTRAACRRARKTGVKVFYTAHGFHFYRKAPLKNWLVFYPIEWLCSFVTDVLITINHEDYMRAKKHLHAKETAYIPGVGIDIGRYKDTQTDLETKRKSMGISETDKFILSVGELNDNKNHKIVIEALYKIKDEHIHYAVAGVGGRKKDLEQLVKTCHLEKRVHLLGFRKDVPELLKVCDLYIHPSFREGLPVSLMEAIASKTPVLCSDIRGCRDLTSEKDRFDPTDVNGLADLIVRKMSCDTDDDVELNYKNLQIFSVGSVNEKLGQLYCRYGK